MTVTSSRTNGFLFADLRDYTRYVEAHGDRAAAALLDAYRELVRAAVAEFGGAEIKTEGDSFYVVFPSASSAVQCGLAILDAAAKAGDRDGAPIRVGIGIHAGETVETSEGYVGSAVNMAARVCSQAKPGELLVTDTVRALTRTLLDVRFVDRRVRKLKGIEESVTLYRVEPAVEDAAAVPAKPVTGVRRSVRSAVLLIGLLIGGAAAGYVILAASRPPSTSTATPTPPTLAPASSATPVPTPTPTVNATFPNADESDLLEQVPAGIRDACDRDDAAPLARTIATVRCDLPLNAEADTVWYHRYESSQAMRNYLTQLNQEQLLPNGDCSADVSRAYGQWQTGQTHSGTALCYQTGGETWIVWTYGADRILARAVREGDTAEDWHGSDGHGLFDWWTQVRLFLESGG
jgi:class 3 adenylate cyclase